MSWINIRDEVVLRNISDVTYSGAGYYLYTAGGDPKAAEKYMEGIERVRHHPKIAC